MSHFLEILWVIWQSLWLIVFPTDMVLLCVRRLYIRMLKGWVRRRLIRRFGPEGPTYARWWFWGMCCIPGMVAIVAGAWLAGYILINTYWLVLGIVNLIDFLTSWENPPWKRVAKYLSARILELLGKMGERKRSRGKSLPVPA